MERENDWNTEKLAQIPGFKGVEGDQIHGFQPGARACSSPPGLIGIGLQNVRKGQTKSFFGPLLGSLVVGMVTLRWTKSCSKWRLAVAGELGDRLKPGHACGLLSFLWSGGRQLNAVGRAWLKRNTRGLEKPRLKLESVTIGSIDPNQNHWSVDQFDESYDSPKVCYFYELIHQFFSVKHLISKISMCLVRQDPASQPLRAWWFGKTFQRAMVVPCHSGMLHVECWNSDLAVPGMET